MEEKCFEHLYGPAGRPDMFYYSATMGKSMARELALIESQEHARTYASEDQRLREDYAQMLADDRDQLRKKNVRKKCAQNVKSNVK